MMKNAVYQAVNLRTGKVIAKRVRVAEDFKSRSVGLLNRRSLDSDEGLLIRPCHSIHTFFMRFPIDLLFLNKKGRVLKIVRSLPAWRLEGCFLKGYMVLEMAAGSLKETDVRLEDVVEIMM